MNWPSLAKPGAIVVIAVLMFFINGEEATKAFLEGEHSQAIIGGFGIILALILGWVGNQLGKESKQAS